ncbi:MAG: DUF1015 domain-containing protein [Solirubrobacterales bacterium]|nr:DUF1015 domain-containing protein [Solirubrobacterales bacterium]
MPEVKPLCALHYNVAKTGGLQRVIAPPYDVIDERQREQLEARSPYNVVAIDLPRANGNPYENAARKLAEWQREGVIVHDDTPSLWLLGQQYTGPDGVRRTRRGVLGRVRVEHYGAGTIRPHERTHAGPKEDRLRLTRATRTNLSPIFSLYDDPEEAVSNALASFIERAPFGEAIDDDLTADRLWRVDDGDAIATVAAALATTELLIADGHHRYEMARQYAEELGGDGPHRYVLMCLVAMQDPGLTVFPTHRLIDGLTRKQHEALADAIRNDFEVAPLRDTSELAPSAGDGVRMGYIDAYSREPFMLILKDQSIADAALPGHSSPYRRLDTAVLESLILKGALGMSDEQIDHLEGLAYARNVAEALARIERGDCDAAFLMAPTPIEQVRSVAAAGETMPPKSTYFFPKVPTGLVFNSLTE